MNEPLAGLPTDEPLPRAAHKSLRAAENDIQDGIETWNENPGLFA